MNKFSKSLLFFIFSVTIAFSQNSKQDFGLYNIGLGSVVGGIGAIINKKSNEKFGNVLIKGIWQGALGGAVVYQSKILIGKISENQNLNYAWIGSISNSIGNSIIENAALNKKFYEQINLNIGFNRIEIFTVDKFHIKYKLMPISLILLSYVATKSKFELETSLKTGQFNAIFIKQKLSILYQ